MCDCNEKKDCCGCLKGGCECVCSCGCHAAPDNPCSTFPRLNCPECIAAEEARRRRTEEIMAEGTRRYNAGLPSDAEIKRVLGRGF